MNIIKEAWIKIEHMAAIKRGGPRIIMINIDFKVRTGVGDLIKHSSFYFDSKSNLVCMENTYLSIE